MIHAYDKIYLEKARTAFGKMLDFSVNDLNLDLSDFWSMFLKTNICRRFEKGDTSLLSGMSGIEMAYEIVGENYRFVKPSNLMNRSEEYWLGWALAYYQWYTDLRFGEITEAVPITKIRAMYIPYHEMDIRHFCDKMNELYTEKNKITKLKKLRLAAGLSQSELAKNAEVPVRTIQQYEQRQKNINKAQAETVIKLANALFCKPEELMEKVLGN